MQLYTDEDGALICPRCGENHLHHTQVEIYTRAEDAVADRITVTTANKDNKYKLSVDQLGKNPSSRRSGIRIYFKCENCEHISSFIIQQHKGQTFLGN